MGLIKAGTGAAGGVLADQWKEFFYCDAMDSDVLAQRGEKRTGRRSSNTKGSDNVISNGSSIAVADGQCMMIVDQGKITEVCAEPGEYIYDTSSEPSIFAGSLGQSVADTFRTMLRRFTYGGDEARDQRIYYFNTKELVDNKFGTPVPIPFRVADANIGLDMDVSVRCSGVYSYRITNPLLFYTNVCGNVEDRYTREELDQQLKTEFISALQPAFAQISQMGIRPSGLPAHAQELSQAMNQALTEKWSALRGISVVSIAMNPIVLSKEDEELIRDAQRAAILRNPSMAAAVLAQAQADAMKTAAANENGAMTGFMGMGMASQAGGANLQSLYQMGAAQASAPAASSPQGQSQGQPQAQTGSAGAAQPASWTCSCGTVNKGNFCYNCGAPRPASQPRYRCSSCGWEPEDPSRPPRFCPNCGNPFGPEDRQ